MQYRLLKILRKQQLISASRWRNILRRLLITPVQRWHSNSRCSLCGFASHGVTSPLTAADLVGDQLTGISSADACNGQLGSNP
eukprot:6142179-Prymnesium_polylepis.2